MVLVVTEVVVKVTMLEGKLVKVSHKVGVKREVVINLNSKILPDQADKLHEIEKYKRVGEKLTYPTVTQPLLIHCVVIQIFVTLGQGRML